MVSVFLHSTLHYITEGSSICISSKHTFLQFNINIQYTYLPTVQYRYPVHLPSSPSCYTADTYTFFHCTPLNITYNTFHIYLQYI